MRVAIMIFFAAITAASAQVQLSASLGATNIVVTSETIEEPAWARRVVMKDNTTGKVKNDGGKVGDAAKSAAAGEAAEVAAEIGEAANTAMTNALQALTTAQSSAATNAIALALVVVPETSRTNFTAYVVKTETTGNVDTQWVWYNRQIDLAPNRFVVYQTFDRAVTNKAAWVDWGATTNITHNGRTWEGCHVCTVTRPTWARGVACLDLPNDRLGGQNGFDFGDMLVTVGGTPAYTGVVTNGVTGAVLYFDNGFCKGTP